MQKVLLADIVQFRLIEVDGTKIPIFVDEATPHQREEYHGVVKDEDPLVMATQAPQPKRNVLTESKAQNLKKKAAPRSKLPKPTTSAKVEPQMDDQKKSRKPENVRDLARFSFGAVSKNVKLREKAKKPTIKKPPTTTSSVVINRVILVLICSFLTPTALMLL